MSLQVGLCHKAAVTMRALVATLALMSFHVDLPAFFTTEDLATNITQHFLALSPPGRSRWGAGEAISGEIQVVEIRGVSRLIEDLHGVFKHVPCWMGLFQILLHPGWRIFSAATSFLTLFFSRMNCKINKNVLFCTRFDV